MRILPILLNLLLIANCFAGQLKPPRGMQISRGHPQSRGLVGFWLFNEGSGNTVFDLSGNNNEGTLEADTHWVPGKYGSALNFDGAGDYVNIGNDASLNITGDITIVSLVKINSFINAQFIFDNGAGNTAGYYLRVNTNGALNYITNQDGANQQTLSSAGAITIGSYYHIAVTRSGTSAKTYTNGIDNTTTTGSHIDPTPHPIAEYIGAEFPGGNHFNGIINYVMIYNRALSAGEIAKLYPKPFCMFQQDVPLMAVEAPVPGRGQVIMITSLPVLFIGLYICRKYKAEVL